MLTGSREGSKVLYRNIVSEVFYCHRSFAIVPGINAEKIARVGDRQPDSPGRCHFILTHWLMLSVSRTDDAWVHREFLRVTVGEIRISLSEPLLDGPCSKTVQTVPHFQ